MRAAAVAAMMMKPIELARPVSFLPVRRFRTPDDGGAPEALTQEQGKFG
jgi:hypothetical protein